MKTMPLMPGDFVSIPDGPSGFMSLGMFHIIAVGTVITRWDQACRAIRHGWRITGAYRNGLVRVSKRSI